MRALVLILMVGLVSCVTVNKYSYQYNEASLSNAIEAEQRGSNK